MHIVCPFLDFKPSSNRMVLIESSDPKASENSCFAFETMLMEARKLAILVFFFIMETQALVAYHAFPDDDDDDDDDDDTCMKCFRASTISYS
ncbi:hypothetical protein Gotur_016138 [Gossypium turneri]